jgi:hypothetical protein
VQPGKKKMGKSQRYKWFLFGKNGLKFTYYEGKKKSKVAIFRGDKVSNYNRKPIVF